MASTFINKMNRKPPQPSARTTGESRANPVKVSSMITKPGAKGGGCGPCSKKRGRP